MALAARGALGSVPISSCSWVNACSWSVRRWSSSGMRAMELLTPADVLACTLQAIPPRRLVVAHVTNCDETVTNSKVAANADE